MIDGSGVGSAFTEDTSNGEHNDSTQAKGDALAYFHFAGFLVVHARLTFHESMHGTPAFVILFIHR